MLPQLTDKMSAWTLGLFLRQNQLGEDVLGELFAPDIYSLKPRKRCCYNLVGLRTKLFSSQTFFRWFTTEEKDGDSASLYR